MVNYERIVASNPWWSQGVQFAANDPDLTRLRMVAAKFNRKNPTLGIGEIHVIKGPKRIGKTVWIKSRIAKALQGKEFSQRDIFYFSFDDVKSEVEFRNMLRWFMDEQPHEGKLLMFLDEIQTVNNWQNILKTLYDSGAFKNASVVITGSLAHALELDELVGRVKESNIFLMRPVSFVRFVENILNPQPPNFGVQAIKTYLNYDTSHSEVDDLLKKVKSLRLDLQGDPKSWKEKVDSLVPHIPLLNKFLSLYIRTGGYPMIINQWLVGNPSIRVVDINNAYSDIYTYTKNDAALVASGRPRDPLKAAKVLESVLRHVGQRISNTSMARAVDLDPVTFASYLRRLQSSFAFLSIRGMDYNLEQTIIGKTYFADVAMHYAVGSSYFAKNAYDFIEQTIQSNEVGTILEEVVAQHLVQVRETGVTKQYDSYLKFLQLQSKKEIDFVYLDDAGVPIGIEIKYQNTISPRDLVKSKGISRYVIVTKDDISFDGEAALIPASIFLALLPESEFEM